MHRSVKWKMKLFLLSKTGAIFGITYFDGKQFELVLLTILKLVHKFYYLNTDMKHGKKYLNYICIFIIYYLCYIILYMNIFFRFLTSFFHFEFHVDLFLLLCL